MADRQVADDIATELSWDPEVDSRAVAVSEVGGVVTLRGTVGSPHEKAARTAASRVRGVGGVTDELEVHLLGERRRADADLRGDVRRALALDFRIPPTVEASVQTGAVMLTGPVSWEYQQVAAETVAGRVPGVSRVENEIYVESVEPVATDITHAVRRALARDGQLDAEAVEVLVGSGWVTLTGRVHSWSAHETAVDAAWAAPGVMVVEDRLTVLP